MIAASAYFLPKRGNREAEWEDAYSIAEDKRRFAVADGASEASFSKEWASQLVRAFKHRRISIPIDLGELAPLQHRWQEKVVNRKVLAWYAEEKACSGAFAAFVGLEFFDDQTDSGERIWRASAAGDSCLVQIRGDSIRMAFPLADSSSFNNRPDLLCSLPAFNGINFVKTIDGSWGCDDCFFLMTDALACWFFREAEAGGQPWNILRDLDTRDQMSFEKLVGNLREEHKMKNDDVTLVRIDILT